MRPGDGWLSSTGLFSCHSVMRPVSAYISDRAAAVDASGIRKVFDLAAKMPDPINLSIGLPDYDVPEVAKKAAIAAIESGGNRYTQTQGIAPLREVLRQRLSAEFGRDCGEVLITSGVSGGLFLAILATINPGDEAVFLDPYFVMYKHLLTLAGGKAVTVDSYPDFHFPAEKVAAAITPKTKLLILNSPANPTGYVMSEQDVRAAVEIAQRHGLILISDEIYEPFLYDGNRGQKNPGDSSSLATAHRPLPTAAKSYDRTIVLRGFSKSHAMTGWRLGYAVGPDEIIAEMTKLQQYTFVCAPSPLQQAALSVVDAPMTDAVAAYRRKRDIAYEVLSRKFEVVRPEGAFYIFPKAPEGTTAAEFCTRAIEHNVLVIPGNVFSNRDTHFRISYATTDQRLREGCEILCNLA